MSIGHHADPKQAASRQLFIAGCPRSGTSALMDLLNSHDDIALGKERFKKCRTLDQSLFDIEHFVNPKPSETNISAPAHYAMIKEKLAAGPIAYIGDKTPGYYRRLEHLLSQFPEAKILIIWRDPVRVASSFQFRSERPSGGWSQDHDFENAVQQWNSALSKAQLCADGPYADRLMLVKYEWFFGGDLTYLDSIMTFLGLTLSSELRRAYGRSARRWNRLRKKPLHLTSQQLAWVNERADHSLGQWADMQSCLDLVKHTVQVAKQDQELSTPDLKLIRQFATVRESHRLEQLKSLTRPAQPTAIIPGLKSFSLQLRELEAKAQSLAEQLLQAENSRWSKLGANLQRIRQPGSSTEGQNSLSDQATQLSQRISRCAQLAGRDAKGSNSE